MNRAVRRLAGALLMVMSCVVTACGGGISNNYLEWSQRSFAEAPEAAFGPRDRFSLEIYPDETLSRVYTVSSQGTINLPLIGALRVGGRTCGDVEIEVARRLRDGFLRDPSVSCTLTEVNSQQIVVVGAVMEPGPVAYNQGLTLIDLVSQVGGFAATAAKDRVQLTRVVDGEAIEIIVPFQQVIRGRAPNMMLWPGDIIYVPTAGLLQ